ncbi:MAG: hypothetical protein RMN25_06485 [Anaerolineae bacterium]|nr:hypothetical protein [Thermoflexales bacterium]MDW8407416.1 hypothetical protein [Anaerolineae bacterium]
MLEGNLIYLAAAYVVFVGGIVLYAASLAWRRRNLERDERKLEEIARDMKDERRNT